MQNIELGELDCMSEDSVMLKLHVSVQFQYEKDALIPIILEQFNADDNYKNALRANMRSTILNTCLQYTAIEYYEMRSSVDSTMSANLKLAINPKIGSSIQYFQLLDIKYPDEYMDILHRKQNIRQNLVTAENDRNTAIINANTNKKESSVNANINLINANNIANMTNYNAVVQQSITLANWHTRSSYYKSIVNQMGLTIPQLLNYIKADVTRSSTLYSSNN
jgi:regulator of protease activity HflC (stomatin/prohibitin superfamily)